MKSKESEPEDHDLRQKHAKAEAINPDVILGDRPFLAVHWWKLMMWYAAVFLDFSMAAKFKLEDIENKELLPVVMQSF